MTPELPPQTHVVVATAGSFGDMYPFLGLARGLMSRGYRVSVVGPAAHAASVVAAGVPYTGLGTEAEYLAALEDPDLWHPRKGFEVVWRNVLPGLGRLAEHVETLPADEPCVLVAHPLLLPAAGLVRARRPGLRILAAWLAPANLRTMLDPLVMGPMRIAPWVPTAIRRALWRLIDARIIDPVAIPGLNAERARFGLAPVEHFVEHITNVADASLALFPSWFCPKQPGWPTSMEGGAFPLYDPTPEAALDDELERFLQADGDAARPVVFTPGSGNRQAAVYFERALEATRRLGRRAIFLTPHRAQVPARLPEDVLWHPYVPLRRLLPRVAALAHHGGIGTTAEALRAGVPQLIIPLAFDQFDNGSRVEALRAGHMLTGWRTRPRGLARALDDLLRSPDLRAGCARAAALVAADEHIDPAARLEPLLGVTPWGQVCFVKPPLKKQT